MIKGYVNMYKMEVARGKIMSNCNFICKVCGGKARIIHHIDGSKINHNEENLMPVCDKCHAKFHHNAVDVPKLNVNKINSLIMLKGLTRKSISESTGISQSSLSILLKKKSTKDETVKKIADLLDCNVQDLLTEEYIARLEDINTKHYSNLTINPYIRVKNEFKLINIKIPIEIYNILSSNNNINSEDFASYLNSVLYEESQKCIIKNKSLTR